MAKRDRRQRKQMKRQERLRQEKHRRWSQPTERESEEPPELRPEPEMLTSRSGMLGMEHDMRRISKELSKRDFKSKEDLEAFLNGLTGRPLDEILGPDDDDPQERAHDLARQAMEADTPEEADELAKKALELDPFCIDALSVRAQLWSGSREELIASLRKVVQSGREAFGEKFFEERRGHFWGVLETRPFMRAKAFLAQQLAADGRDEEAIAEYEQMLELNPGDNQGVRFSLTGLYLANDRLEDSRRLRDMHSDDVSAVMAWGALLEDLLAGDETEAGRALKHARTRNPHVEPYFTGERPLPEDAPDEYTLGGESEAEYCAFELGRAWMRHQDAVEWLRAQTT